MSTNETSSAHRRTIAGSNRNFGLVFAIVFILIGLAPVVLHDEPIRLWAFGVASAFCFLALVVPQMLDPLNRLWFRFGLALHYVTNPIVMGFVYYGAVMPTGILLRVFGKDLLRLKREPDAATYWIARERPAPLPGSMSKQF
jgi:hypothetical protein